MATAGARIDARFDEEAFGLDVRRYRPEPRARRVAAEARDRFEREGVPIAALRACEPEARDGSQLEGLVKLYLPLGAAPALERPFGMVFDPIDTAAWPVLNYIAFGVRHQPRDSRAPTVYAIAHHRLHGRWPRRP